MRISHSRSDAPTRRRLARTKRGAEAAALRLLEGKQTLSAAWPGGCSNRFACSRSLARESIRAAPLAGSSGCGVCFGNCRRSSLKLGTKYETRPAQSRVSRQLASADGDSSVAAGCRRHTPEPVVDTAHTLLICQGMCRPSPESANDTIVIVKAGGPDHHHLGRGSGSARTRAAFWSPGWRSCYAIRALRIRH